MTWTGYAFALAGALCFGINGSISKVVLQTGMPADRLAGIRATGAALGLFCVLALTRPGSLRITRREVPLLVAAGLTGVALIQWLYFVSIARLPVGVALLIEYTAPVVVALWARFGLPVRARRPVGRRVWTALGLVVVGLALVAQVWTGFALDPLGLLAAGGAAAALAAYFLLVAHGVGARDGASLTAWMFLVGGLAWSLLRPWWVLPAGLPTAQTAAGLPVWAMCIGVVVIGTIAPYLLLAAALRRLPATRASIASTAEPVFAGLVAWIALGEVLSPVQLVGTAVILTGIVLAQTAPAVSVDLPAA